MEKTPFTKRLKEARLETGLSQAVLGEKAGIDPGVASTRMNQYERGVHTPSYSTMKHIANVLSVPVAYFFTEDDRLAEHIKLIHRLPKKKQAEVFKLAASSK